MEANLLTEPRNHHLLDIRNLNVSFEQHKGIAHALRGIDLCLKSGEILALVGESGSGKTVTSMSVMGLLTTPPCRVNGGEIIFQGRNLLTLAENDRRKVRGKDIGMIFQEPGKYLNPAYKIGEQITETLILHFKMTRRSAVEQALEFLNLVGLGKNKRVLNSYPHELSGGMKQRAMIAMSVACHPALLIADEPTTALDVTLQLQILKLIQSLKDKFSMGVLFISHDLGVVKEIADRTSVIYAGRIVESATRQQLFENPIHPYTKLLLLSIPDAAKRGTRLRAIPGTVPDAENIPGGCSFHPRCPLVEEGCRREIPPTIDYGDGHKAACFLIGKKWIDS
jgi:oligopeptide/dipeptide ABC transporter ATP-binding protein